MFDARSMAADAACLTVTRAPELPVAKLVTGKPVTDVAELLPRLFNLCRAAQAACARMAFGLPVEAAAQDALRREILRDHLLKFHVSWPGHYGFPPVALPGNWAAGDASLAPVLFGAPGRLPSSADDFRSFLSTDSVIARSLSRIEASFGPGEADSGFLPSLTSGTAFDVVAAENSVAARHALHPVMRWIAETYGYGPLWRATARAYDIGAVIEDRLPVPRQPAPGRAVVAATRGTYAVSARVVNGRVAAFTRVTPTDHLMASGGILDRTLATLPAAKAGYAPLILDILDPCAPVRVREVADA